MGFSIGFNLSDLQENRLFGLVPVFGRVSLVGDLSHLIFNATNSLVIENKVPT